MQPVYSVYSAPKAVAFNKHVSTIPLSIHGQCVFVFNTSDVCSFTFFNRDASDGLQVYLTTEHFFATRLTNGNKYFSQTTNAGITDCSGAYYWFSLDSQNQVFQAGIGEPRLDTCCYKYAFDHSDPLREANKLFLESLVKIEVPETVVPLRLLKDPITTPVPLLIKNTNQLTMEDIASNAFLPHSALSPASRGLYDCISGGRFVLNTPDFPDFSEAIEHSIQTPGLWCNTRLSEKATEFSKIKHPLETYLRITLGQNNGESPGIPYVMEIWPSGHFSPIHNHGNAAAIIRVLHGSIQAELYPYLCDEPNTVDPFATAIMNTGDITWLSPTLNQVHKLTNPASNTHSCITIQCYSYEVTDSSHYDYFDYIGEHGAKQQYEPDSDMDFLQFKKTMKEEWDNRFKSATKEPAHNSFAKFVLDCLCCCCAH